MSQPGLGAEDPAAGRAPVFSALAFPLVTVISVHVSQDRVEPSHCRGRHTFNSHRPPAQAPQRSHGLLSEGLRKEADPCLMAQGLPGEMTGQWLSCTGIFSSDCGSPRRSRVMRWKRTEGGLKGRHLWLQMPFLLLLHCETLILAISFSIKQKRATEPTSYELR